MKVSKLIKQLQELDPNEEIVVMYWAKGLFDDWYGEDNTISVDDWQDTITAIEDRDWLDGVSSSAHEIIEATLDRVRQGQ